MPGPTALPQAQKRTRGRPLGVAAANPAPGSISAVHGPEARPAGLPGLPGSPHGHRAAVRAEPRELEERGGRRGAPGHEPRAVLQSQFIYQL